MMSLLLRLINSLFGRSALLMISLVALVQITVIMLVGHHLGEHNSTRDAQYVELAFQLAKSPVNRPILARKGIYIINTDSAQFKRCPNQCKPIGWSYEASLNQRLGSDYQLVLDKNNGHGWVQSKSLNLWLYIPNLGIEHTGFELALMVILCLVVLASFILYWQLRRPILKLSVAAHEFRQNRQPSQLKPSGPRELSALMRQFNEMTQSLYEFEKDRTVMLAGIAHDLRTPITRMQVRANLLDDSSLTSGFLKDCKALSGLIRQFIDFAKTPDQSEPVSVNALCLQLAQRYSDMPLSLQLDVDDQLCVPEKELERILSNLIENAKDYGKPEICLQTKPHHQGVAISVIDHGIGMSQEQWEQALKPFSRLDKSRSGSHSGLGLAIVHRLVMHLQGELKIEHQEKTFQVTVLLPVTLSPQMSSDNR